MSFCTRLVRLTMSAGIEKKLFPLTVILHATERGTLCFAETIIESKEEMYRLFKGFRLEDGPPHREPDMYVANVLVAASKTPWELLEEFQRLCEHMEGMTLSLVYEIVDPEQDVRNGDTTTNTSRRVIFADYMEEASLGTDELVPTGGGKALVLSHGERHWPKNRAVFWTLYAEAVRKTGLCERVVEMRGELGVVLTEDAVVSKAHESLLAVIACYPLPA